MEMLLGGSVTVSSAWLCTNRTLKSLRVSFPYSIFFSSFISLNTIGRGRSRKYSGIGPIVDGCSMYTHAQKNNLVPNKRTKPVSRQNRRQPPCLNSLIRELTFLRTRVDTHQRLFLDDDNDDDDDDDDDNDDDDDDGDGDGKQPKRRTHHLPV